jgi:acid phosphatase (class A)
MRGAMLPMAAMLLVAATGPGPAVAPPLLVDAIRPDLILPPPPHEGGAEADAELAELHRIEAARSPAELAQAMADDKTKDVTIFSTALGPNAGLLDGPAVTRLFLMVRVEEKRDADAAKAFFRRNRPWIVDPALQSCSRHDEPASSYPSGHTTMGYAMAAILARLMPMHGQAIMARAADYARDRLVCGVHFRSDVVAGQALGMIVAERLMEDPGFRASFAAAAEEIGAAKGRR